MTTPNITTYPALSNYQINPLVWRKMRPWSLTIFGTVLFAISLFTLIALAKNDSVESSTLINLANQERIENGLSTLQSNHALQEAAYAKAQDMFNNQYFEHVSPAGKTPWKFISSANYKYTYAGENLAIDFTNLEATHKAWMNSPSHKANIIEPHYRDIGIASIKGEFEGRPTIITVEMFGASPMDNALQKIQNLW